MEQSQLHPPNLNLPHVLGIDDLQERCWFTSLDEPGEGAGAGEEDWELYRAFLRGQRFADKRPVWATVVDSNGIPSYPEVDPYPDYTAMLDYKVAKEEAFSALYETIRGVDKFSDPEPDCVVWVFGDGSLPYSVACAWYDAVEEQLALLPKELADDYWDGGIVDPRKSAKERAFLRELDSMNIPYRVLHRDPYKPCMWLRLPGLHKPKEELLKHLTNATSIDREKLWIPTDPVRNVMGLKLPGMERCTSSAMNKPTEGAGEEDWESYRAFLGEARYEVDPPVWKPYYDSRYTLTYPSWDSDPYPKYTAWLDLEREKEQAFAEMYKKLGPLDLLDEDPETGCVLRGYIDGYEAFYVPCASYDAVNEQLALMPKEFSDGYWERSGEQLVDPRKVAL
ncbi:hypothetical protein BJ508DRAFT_330644 [Ascobolus immersus RN42]|uniref:Uncharacterized protein n=1 Tax=Ascobolus immersus RN42 TaxID=1160509 RepID=A0A3N4I556_ASCIM|nr:hypothetical protein BJ508DRAFT_330644 [Ascobolus immersus RN42]